MIRGPKKTVHLLIPLELYNRLNQMAQDSHRTLPGYIRQILVAYVRHAQEDEGAGERWLIR